MIFLLAFPLAPSQSMDFPGFAAADFPSLGEKNTTGYRPPGKLWHTNYGKWPSRKCVSFPMNSMVIWTIVTIVYQRMKTMRDPRWPNISNIYPCHQIVSGTYIYIYIYISNVLLIYAWISLHFKCPHWIYAITNLRIRQSRPQTHISQIYTSNMPIPPNQTMLW